MPTEAFPLDMPTHDKDGVNSTDPTSSAQLSGYGASTSAPSSEFNFLFNRQLRALLSLREKPIKDWLTATSFFQFEIVLAPDTKKIYQANVDHTSTGTTLTQNDSAKWDLISDNIDDTLGPFVDGDMVVGDTATTKLKKSTVETEVRTVLGVTGADPGIRNGNLSHWAINTTVSSAPSNTYIADLWKYGKIGPQVHDLFRSTDVPTVADGARAGALFSMHMDVTTVNTGLDATENTALTYSMEGFDFASYFGKTFTLSFLVKSNKTGTYVVAFRNGPTPTRSYVAEYTISSADTWEKKTITVIHDTTGTWNLDASLGMFISWTMAAGATFQATPGSWQSGNFFGSSGAVNFDDNSSNEIRLAQITMNIGSIANDNLKPDAEELERIARYFKIYQQLRYGFFKSVSGVLFRWGFPYEREMRAIPVVSFTNITPSGAISSPSVELQRTSNLTIALSSTSASAESVHSAFDLTLDARF